MNRRFISLVLPVFLLVGCYKNDFGQRRFKPNRFSVTPNSNQNYVNIIDTLGFYIPILDSAFVSEYNLEDYQSGLKFYSNGKFGLFKGVDMLNPASFKPDQAQMGYYNYSSKGFVLEYFYKVPGRKYRRSIDSLLITQSSIDTLYIQSFRSATSIDEITKYIKVPLPINALKFKPDW